VVCDWERVHVEERSQEQKGRIASSNQRGTGGNNVHEEGWLRASRRDTVELQFFILEEKSNKKA